MIKKIKLVGFADRDCEQQWVVNYLSRDYDLQLCDDNNNMSPDYLFYGGFGREYYEYDCIKVAIIGENYVPDFNAFDYAISSNYVEFGDRHLRVPLFALYNEYKTLAQQSNKSDDELLNRGFCSFVVSNGNRGDPIRTEFFHRLSEYKLVASGGRWLNNIGGPVADKLDFCAKYKFNIAFENSSCPGYTTEKIMQPLTVNSIPIYWGDPFVTNDFNEDCMVRVRSREDIDRAIEEIIYLDTHDDAYLDKVRRRSLALDDINYYDRSIMEFFHAIMDPPIEESRRVNRYGFQNDLNKQMRHLARVNNAFQKYGVYKMVSAVRKFKSKMGF